MLSDDTIIMHAHRYRL